SFALGPYLVDHLQDSATVVAAPLILLLLLTLEAHLTRGGAARATALAAALALLLLAGSPEAVRAGGALVAGRLLVAWRARSPQPPGRVTAAALLAGLLLAAPQLLPTLLTAGQAGRAVTGLA